MDANRRQQFLLGALLLVLAAIVGYQVTRQPATPPGAPSNEARAEARRHASAPAGPVPEVDLEALQEVRPQPAPIERNLFQFGPARPLPRSGSDGPAGHRPPGIGPGRGAPPAMAPPAAPVAIPLKFIGILSAPGRIGRIAVLTDGRSVYHGREGDIILGRYRIAHIGIESIVLVSLDNGAQQTIRLTGGGL